MSPLPCAILMAKRPDPGAVKTRLTSAVVATTETTAGDGKGRARVEPMPALSPDRAGRIARAMLECVYGRLRSVFRDRVILAVTPDDAGDLDLPHVDHIVPQGSGALGQRMNTAWLGALQVFGQPEDLPVAFFGMDSPDVPFDVLLRLELVLRGQRQHVARGEADDLAQATTLGGNPGVWIGPTQDGGYWTLACRAHHPILLDGVEWGSPHVCEQTVRSAESAGLCVERLRTWYDVDRPADLAALRDRIEGSHEPMLRVLAQRLDQIGITPE